MAEEPDGLRNNWLSPPERTRVEVWEFPGMVGGRAIGGLIGGPCGGLKALTPTLSRGRAREEKALTPALSQRERRTAS
jgi:hypothetical protein